jgi:hypothetical protein
VSGAIASLRALPARDVPWFLAARAWQRAVHAWQRRRDPRHCSFGPLGPRLQSRLRPGPDVAPAGPHAHDPRSEQRVESSTLRAADPADAFLSHRFDLLGSGPVRVGYGCPVAGFEDHRYDPGPAVPPDPSGGWLEGRVNDANLAEARRIWSMVDPEYEPIDWQLDFRSGYRWSARQWHADVRYGTHPGADVKVPWELGRMQHLVQMGMTAAASGEPATVEGFAREFRNQLLDFIAANPPRWGVQWASPMDVAIRIASWVVAWDLLAAAGASFDPEFEAELGRSVAMHARHVIAHLEWSPRLRGNHYLANVVGLLFAGAYLPAGPEPDGWLRFGVQALEQEVDFQFLEDGACFEGSTGYHRLSSEMVGWATALLLGMPAERLAAARAAAPRHYRGIVPPARERGAFPPPGWSGRLRGMRDFAADATRNRGGMVLFGDMDSGRFLAPAPAPPRDSAPLLELMGALCGEPAASADGVLAHWLSRGRTLAREPVPAIAAPRDPALLATHGALEAGASGDCIRRYRFAPGGDGLARGLRVRAYPRFGMYVMRSDRLYLAIRCGPVGQRGNGGHAHNDALALELQIDGEEWLVDPGVYTYTALPELRDTYRSVQAHWAPRAGELEPGDLRRGLFRLPERADARCVHLGETTFLGVHQGYGFPVYRRVEVTDQAVEVVDLAPGGQALDLLPDGRPVIPPVPVADGYGLRRPAPG